MFVPKERAHLSRALEYPEDFPSLACKRKMVARDIVVIDYMLFKDHHNFDCCKPYRILSRTGYS